MKIEKVAINLVKQNPNNPRVIKDDKFKKLVKSIQEFPEMLSIRPIVVNEDMITLGGNQRLKACKAAGLTEVFIIRAIGLSEAQQSEFVLKDNSSFGEWDFELLANTWDMDLIKDAGIEIPDFKFPEPEDISDKIKTQFKIEVICASESEQEKYYNKLIEEGYECRILTL
jgi:hypothetical protein